MTSILAFWPSCPCDWWKARQPGRLPTPIFRFQLIAMQLLPEQVIAGEIVRDRHVEGAARVHFPLLRQLHIVLADLRALDRQVAVGRSSCQAATLVVLGFALLDPA